MGHLNHGASRFDKTPAEWLGVGSQINEVANEWADRSDIVTFVGTGAGHGAPACFVPALAEMEVDVALAFGEGTDPITIPNLTKRTNQFDYPVAMGAVLHEAMHARHSKYDLAEVAKLDDKFVSTLITVFEEIRIEARGIETYPMNRSFLRACALHLVLGDLREDENFAERGIKAFSQLLVLTLGRVEAGVLDASDVKIVEDAAVALFGTSTLDELRGVMRKAIAHKIDSDWKALEARAHEWIEILNESGNAPSEDGSDIPEWLKEMLEQMVGSGSGEESEGQSSGGSSNGGGEGEEEGKGSGKPLLEEMAENTQSEAQSEANSQAVEEVTEAANAARAAAAAEAAEHDTAASEVYGRGTGPGGGRTRSRKVESRPPTADERRAAVALAKQLEKAQYRDRVTVKRGSVIPPGRMKSRAAIAAQEQIARGSVVTAEAWTRKMRKHTDDPSLTVGVLVDISGSMGGAMEPMASAAWVLSEATRRVQGKISMVYYGDSVFPTLAPGQHMKEVEIYNAPDGSEQFDQAFMALNGKMGLLDSTGARLLVIVSDLHYSGHQMNRTKYWMKRCREAGVAVVVVPFDYDGTAKGVVKGLGGVEVIGETRTRTIVGAANAIGEVAVKQLQVVSQ